jgi:hypothetical protein
MICMFGQGPLSMPSWLVNYPGAAPQIRSSPTYFESTYETTAKPEEVIAHYQKLFDEQWLPFRPSFDGIGTAIRGETPECNLLLLIRRQGTGTWVQVSGAAKSAAGVSTSAPRISTAPPQRRSTAIMSIEERQAEQKEHTRRVLEEADQKHKEQIRGMEKYDRPVYPTPKAPLPALVWPSWLGKTDGTPLDIQRGVDQFGRKFLKGSFVAAATRSEVQVFYAELLSSHGYPIRTQSILAWQRDRKAWVEGEHYINGTSGPRITIRIELMPAGELVEVELRMIARP